MRRWLEYKESLFCTRPSKKRRETRKWRARTSLAKSEEKETVCSLEVDRQYSGICFTETWLTTDSFQQISQVKAILSPRELCHEIFQNSISGNCQQIDTLGARGFSRVVSGFGHARVLGRVHLLPTKLFVVRQKKPLGPSSPNRVKLSNNRLKNY